MSKKLLLPEQLNICIVANRFSVRGGTSTHGFLWPIVRQLSHQGHQITIFSSKSPQRQFDSFRDGVRVLYLNESLENYPEFSDAVKSHFIRLHQEKPFHLIHSIDSVAYKTAKIKKDLKIAVAYDIEATQMHELFSAYGMAQETLSGILRTGMKIAYKFLKTYYTLDRKLLKTADGVFVTSPQQRILLERYYLYPEAKIHTVPYGIEIGDLSPRKSSEDLREKYKIPPGIKTVVTLTDMTELGEIKNLLHAFQRVAIKKPHSRLIIVGSGPYYKDVEFEILNLALGNRVILTGAISSQELPDYIALADVFVNLSSRATGFEPSILEAMAQEKLIIGSEVSPIANIVEDGKDGFLIRPADINALSLLLIEIFAGRLPISEIGSGARRKVTNLFDTSKLVSETLKAYYKILMQTGLYKLHKINYSQKDATHRQARELSP